MKRTTGAVYCARSARGAKGLNTVDDSNGSGLLGGPLVVADNITATNIPHDAVVWRSPITLFHSWGPEFIAAPLVFTCKEMTTMVPQQHTSHCRVMMSCPSALFSFYCACVLESQKCNQATCRPQKCTHTSSGTLHLHLLALLEQHPASGLVTE